MFSSYEFGVWKESEVRVGSRSLRRAGRVGDSCENFRGRYCFKVERW